MSKAAKEIRVNNIITSVTNQGLWDRGIEPTIYIAESSDIANLIHLEEICFDSKLYSSLLNYSSANYAINKSNGLILVSKHLDFISGYAQLMFRNNSSLGRFYSLAVHPDFQGKGTANLLFKNAERVMSILGADTVILEIREDNRALKYRYEKFGYKIYRRIENYYPDGATAVKMRRSIL